MSPDVLAPLVHKLEAVLTLSNDEAQAIYALPVRVKEFRKGEVVIREGDRPTQCFGIVRGTTAVFKLASEGRRQIMSFHLPGDCPDLQSLHLNVLDMGIFAVEPSKLAFIQHEDIRQMLHLRQRLADALWRLTLLDGALLREWILNIGQKSAYQRIAHFLCELTVRSRISGVCEEWMVPMPFTQQELGDALGLSNIHINRVMQELKKAQLIHTSRGRLMVLNWKKLQSAADFDATYLHLTPTQKLLLEGIGTASKVHGRSK